MMTCFSCKSAEDVMKTLSCDISKGSPSNIPKGSSTKSRPRRTRGNDPKKGTSAGLESADNGPLAPSSAAEDEGTVMTRKEKFAIQFAAYYGFLIKNKERLSIYRLSNPPSLQKVNSMTP